MLVAQSSCEAEYIAASKNTNEIAWLREELSELELKQREPTIIFMDSQSAICLTRNPVFHSKIKHIPLKYHHIRDMIMKKQIQVEYVKTGNMTANILTKALEKQY